MKHHNRLSAPAADCVKTLKLLRRWKKDTIFMTKLAISSRHPFCLCFKVGQHERHSDPSLIFHTVWRPVRRSARGHNGTKQRIKVLEELEQATPKLGKALPIPWARLRCCKLVPKRGISKNRPPKISAITNFCDRPRGKAPRQLVSKL